MQKRRAPKKSAGTKTSKKQNTKTVGNELAGTYVFRVLAIVTLSSLLLVSGGLFAYGQTLAERIRPGVWTANLDLGGLTIYEAQRMLAERVLAYEQEPLRFTTSTRAATRTLADLGMRIDIAATVMQAFSVGRSNTVAQNFALPALGARTSVPIALLLDRDAFTEAQRDVEGELGTAVTQPGIVFRDGTVTTTPGASGVGLVMEDFETTFVRDVATLQPLEYRFDTVVVQPSITESDLTESAGVMARMASRPLTLTYGSRRYVVQPSTLEQWVVYRYDEEVGAVSALDGIDLTLDEAQVGAYLEERNKEVGVAAKATFGYEAPALGEYAYKNQTGRAVNIPKTMNAILHALVGEGTPAVELVVEDQEPDVEILSVQAPKPEGKVLSVDIKRQIIFAHENGKLVFWTRTSTGKGGYKTPTGEWHIYAKTRRQVMSGDGYYLPNVQWVMPYNGDYTIHGAYWHTNFGNPMSHGCTNLSNADAEWLYNWAEVGTPVIVYESA